MAEEGITRRLAAILAADVVGYTRLMEADEDATLAAWWVARKEIIDPIIARHAGRIVKHTGDGFLAEFNTVLDAVQSAIAMQAELAAQNADVPGDRRLDFRMGINLGDIVVDDEDIYGDGVNIAARLEALADREVRILGGRGPRPVAASGCHALEVSKAGKEKLKARLAKLRAAGAMLSKLPSDEAGQLRRRLHRGAEDERSRTSPFARTMRKLETRRAGGGGSACQVADQVALESERRASGGRKTFVEVPSTPTPRSTRGPGEDQVAARERPPGPRWRRWPDRRHESATGRLSRRLSACKSRRTDAKPQPAPRAAPSGRAR